MTVHRCVIVVVVLSFLFFCCILYGVLNVARVSVADGLIRCRSIKEGRRAMIRQQNTLLLCIVSQLKERVERERVRHHYQTARSYAPPSPH